MNLFRTPLGGLHLYGVLLVFCLCNNGIDSYDCSSQNGNCSQVCNQNGNCSQVCNHNGNCSQVCNQNGNCSQVCNHNRNCSQVCNQNGNCSQVCNHNGNCSQVCNHNGNCSQVCNHNGNCSQVYNQNGKGSQVCNHNRNCSQVCNHNGKGSQVCNHNGNCSQVCNHNGKGSQVCNHNGNCSQVCDQNEDLCHKGYTLHSDGRTCSDVDECTTISHQCSAGDNFCRNTIGSYTCECPDGYQVKDGDLHNCTDVDECESGAHRCSAGDDFCQNTNGNYSCSCPDGYQFEEGDVHYCTDIDECSTSAHLCQAACTNIPGSYTCTCQGFADESDECKETCAFDFQLKLPKEGGVSSDCPTLDILYSVTLQDSQRLACNISGNVINVLSNVHFIKKCMEGDLQLTPRRGGWDVYHRMKDNQAVSPDSDGAFVTTVIAGVVPCVLLATVVGIITAIVVKRRRGVSTQSRPPYSGHQIQESSMSTTENPVPADDDFEATSHIGGREYEYVDHQKMDIKTNGDHTYCNEAANTYDTLNSNEISVEQSSEYEKISC